LKNLKKIIDLIRAYPLSTKIVVYIFGFAFCSTIIASLAHLFVAYNMEKSRIWSKLDNLEKEQIELLTSNLWTYNTKAVEIQMSGILSNRDFIYIEIRTDGKVEYSAGKKDLMEKGLEKTYPLVYQGKTIGEITIYATTRHIKDRLFMLTAGSLTAQLFGIFLTCLFLVLLLYRMLSRPVFQMLEFTNTIKLDNLDSEFSLDRKNKKPDEIDAVINALDAMRKRLKTDIEEKEGIRKELISEQTFSDKVINSLPGIFFVLDEHRRIIRHNRQFYEQTSGPEEALNFDIFKLIDTRDHEKLEAVFQKVFSHDEQRFSLEVLIINPESASIPYFLNCSRLILQGQDFLIGIGTDLRDRKKMESELQQAQKMESIGTLAGGIAHDFNNILSAIFGYTELANGLYPDNPKLSGYLQNILNAAVRAKELVRQILTFSRKNEQEMVPLKVSLIVKETLKLLRSSIPTTIEIQSKIDSEKQTVSDPTQIHQIIMNLCTNAYQAMQETGGTLSIWLRDIEVNEEETLPGSEPVPGDYILLEVTDTGCGMTPDVMEKIFEPYFTTKETGSGTGLGLAVVHGIIKRNNWYLSVSSNPGSGSSFKVYFPVFKKPYEPPVESVGSENACLTGHEHVMIVDDEKSIRDAVKIILENNGYTVSEYDNGASALECFIQNPRKFDLIITDMTMPKMTGYQLGLSILAVRQELPIILCTGFNETISREKSKNAGFAGFLQKPVESQKLLKEIRYHLDRMRS